MFDPPNWQRVFLGRSLAFCLSIFVLFVFVNPVSAQACYTPPPNSTITRTTDTTLCQGTYNVNITLGADNIRLNCNGSTFFGNGSGAGWNYVIGAIDRINVTIENCVLGGAVNVILFRNTSWSVIQNSSTLSSVAPFGVSPDFACNGSCFRLEQGSNNNTVKNNSVTRAAGLGGINMDLGARDNLIERNSVFSTTAYGIYLSETNTDRNRIVNNTIWNHSNGGIRTEAAISAGPSLTYIFNNTVNGTPNGFCLQLHRTSNSLVVGNNFSYCRYGIRISDGSPGTVVPSVNNTIHSNLLAHNNNFGIWLQQSTNVNNTIYLNYFLNNTQDHVSGSVGTNSFNTTFGNSWDDLNTSNFTDADLDGFYDAGSGYPYTNSTGANVTAGVSDYRPCRYKNCLGLAGRSPAWNAAVSSQTVFFSLRSNAAISASSISVRINGAASAAFASSACTSASSDLLGYTANCTYTETGIVSGSNSIVVNATDGDGVNGNFTLNFTYAAPTAPTPTPGGCCAPTTTTTTTPAAAPTPTPVVETQQALTVPAFTPVVFTFSQAAPVQEVVVETNSLAAAVSITVAERTSRPEGVAEVPGVAAVARYLTIDAKNIAPGDYKRVTLKFTVERAWLDKNGVSDDRVALARYGEAKKEWQTFHATKTKEAGGTATFEATVPGLSLFAIAAESPPSTPIPSAASPGLPASPPPTGTLPSPLQSPPPGGVAPPLETSKPGQPGFVAVVAVVLALVAAALIRRSYRRG